MKKDKYYTIEIENLSDFQKMENLYYSQYKMKVMVKVNLSLK